MTNLQFESGKYNGVDVVQVIADNPKYCKNLVKKYDSMVALKEIVEYLRTKEDEIDELVAEKKLREAEEKEPVPDITEEDLVLISERIDESNCNKRKFKGKLSKLIKVLRQEDE